MFDQPSRTAFRKALDRTGGAPAAAFLEVAEGLSQSHFEIGRVNQAAASAATRMTAPIIEAPITGATDSGASRNGSQSQNRSDNPTAMMAVVALTQKIVRRFVMLLSYCANEPGAPSVTTRDPDGLGQDLVL